MIDWMKNSEYDFYVQLLLFWAPTDSHQNSRLHTGARVNAELFTNKEGEPVNFNEQKVNSDKNLFDWARSKHSTLVGFLLKVFTNKSV